MIDPVHLIDAILLLVLIEFLALVVVRSPKGSKSSRFGLAATLASGGFLLIAARAALLADHGVMMAALVAAGLTHAMDVALRWR